jgi:MSHA biogenesis protein MshP
MKARKSMAGLGVMTAVFLLVAVAGLAVGIVSMLGNQQVSAAQDEQGARAYQAARAGIEWALYIAQPTVTPAPAGLNCPQGQGVYSFGFQALTSLSGFTVTVTCGSITTLNSVNHYTIRATACNEPNANSGAGLLGCPNSVSQSPNDVQRVVEVQL